MSPRPKRPYLLRALYDWLVDSGLTPYLLVDAEGDDVQVPADYVTDGRIVLNVGPNAVRNLHLGNDQVSCDGRFGGRPFPLSIPLRAVLAIYAKESGEGMMFEPEQGLQAPADAPAGPQAGDADADRLQGDAGKDDSARDTSHLRIVK